MKHPRLASALLALASAGCLAAAAPPTVEPNTPVGAPQLSCSELPFADCSQLANFAQSQPNQLLVELEPELTSRPLRVTPFLDAVGGMATSLDPVFAREWQRPF